MVYKLVCFDIDGTLVLEHKERMLAHAGYLEPHEFEDSVWILLHRYFNVMKEAKEQYNAYHKGMISYKDWVEKNIMLWKEAGANEEIINHVFSEFTMPMPGAIETLRELKAAGIKMAVISGGLKSVATHHFKNEFSPVFANDIIYNEQGTIVGAIATPYDFGGKLRGMHEACAMHGVTPAETVFIGDNINDFQVMEEVGLGIAFNSKSEALSKAADVVVTTLDLREILPHVLGNKV